MFGMNAVGPFISEACATDLAPKLSRSAAVLQAGMNLIRWKTCSGGKVLFWGLKKRTGWNGVFETFWKLDGSTIEGFLIGRGVFKFFGSICSSCVKSG